MLVAFRAVGRSSNVRVRSELLDHTQRSLSYRTVATTAVADVSELDTHSRLVFGAGAPDVIAPRPSPEVRKESVL